MSSTPQAQLGEIADLQAGVGFPVDLQGRSSGDYPVAKVGDISRVGRSGEAVISATDHYIDVGDLARLRARPIPAGSVLFAKIGEAIRHNHRVIAGCALLVDNNAMAAIPTRRVESRYLYHFLRSVDFYRLTSATTVPALRKSDLKRLRVPVPPLPGQRRTVEILDKADSLRAKRRAALAHLDTLTQAIFLDMFGDPATNPKGWPVAALGSLGRVTTGRTPPSAKEGMFDGTIPFITPGDLESDQPIKRTVTNAGAEASKTVDAGATLVCCIGATIGKVGKSSVPSAFNQQINALEWGERIHSEYGCAVMRFFKPTIIAWGSSTTLPILRKSSFERIEIPVPPLTDQQQFALWIERLERVRTTHRVALSTSNELFSALQMMVFRGGL